MKRLLIVDDSKLMRDMVRDVTSDVEATTFRVSLPRKSTRTDR